MAHRVQCDELEEGGESLAEPGVGPPDRSDDVSEPLMRKLVGHHSTCVTHVALGGLSLVHQQQLLPKDSELSWFQETSTTGIFYKVNIERGSEPL